MPWINKNHLNEAAARSRLTFKSKLIRYFWHLKISFIEGINLFAISILSFVHGLFPWIIDFELLKWRVKLLKNLKKELKDDPILNKIDFKDSSDKYN